MCQKFKKLKLSAAVIVAASLFLGGCESNPQNVDVKLPKTLPKPTFTVYSNAINKLGMMNLIYDTAPLKIMTTDIADNTGTSVATSAEVPRDITEMVKSALNSIGGNITYIPYDPSFISNNMAVGYSEFSNKLIPDVMVSGGITEFDRGLVTKGKGTEFDIGGTIKKQALGVNFSDEEKASLARVTLDFNLVDFQTFAGIPRIQAINSMKLNKAVREANIGFQIIGSSIGVKGDVKKVQGRHAAVRLLVQLSMLQIVGRYQKIPYWNLIPGATLDQVVVDRVLEDYYAMDDIDKVIKVQQLLFLKGHDIQITGQLDAQTLAALNSFASSNGLAKDKIDAQSYWALYESIPVDHGTRHKRSLLNRIDVAAIKASLLEPKAQMQVKKAVKKKVAKKAQRVKKAEAPETGTLNLWTDKSSYKIGDSMTVAFSVDKPMYVRIVVVSSTGEVSTLFPNPMQSDNYLKPGQEIQIPPKGAEFTLDIGGPVGTDKLMGVASKNPVPANAIHLDKKGNFVASKMKRFPIRSSVAVPIK